MKQVNISDPWYYTINQAGYTIHSAVHGARHDVSCVLHTHTEAGMGISALNCGLLPLNQGALRFYNRVGYHDYEGIALDLEPYPTKWNQFDGAYRLPG